jgi:dTDP-4-dehydrorhamnose reductase
MSAPRLLVLGASGLLGRSVAVAAARAESRELHLLVGRGHAPDVPSAVVHRVDLRDLTATRSWLDRLKPELVINCAGIVKSICDDGYQAVLLNTLLPHLAVEVLRSWNGRLLHVSTDCVFSGDKGDYKESDLADPVDLYGRTKLAGEVTESPHLTVRTSFIGLEHENAKGLLGWFFAQTGRVRGFRRVIWSGLTTEALAQILLSLVERRGVSGLLHVASEPIDKYRLLCLAAEIFGKSDVQIEPVDEPVCDRSLRSDQLSALGLRVPSIRSMLEGLRDSEIRHAEVVQARG